MKMRDLTSLIVLQHTPSPDFVCKPVGWIVFILFIADIYFVVQEFRGRGVIRKTKRLWMRIALAYVIFFISPFLYLALLFTGCGTV